MNLLNIILQSFVLVNCTSKTVKVLHHSVGLISNFLILSFGNFIPNVMTDNNELT